MSFVRDTVSTPGPLLGRSRGAESPHARPPGGAGAAAERSPAPPRSAAAPCRAPPRVLGSYDAFMIGMSVLVALAVVVLVEASAAQGDALAANATVAAVGASFLACVDLAMAPVVPAVATARAVFSGVGNMTRAQFDWLQASTLAGPLEGAAAGARGYMERIGDAGARAAWAARISAEYGRAVVPGSSCAGIGGDLVTSYCAEGGARDGTGACDPPLFECLSPTAASSETTAARHALETAVTTASPGLLAGQYRIFAPARGGLLVAIVDVGAQLAAAAAATLRICDVAVGVVDPSGSSAAAPAFVYSYGVTAGAVALVTPVVAVRSMFDRNLSFSISPSGGMVNAYLTARDETNILRMGLIPVRRWVAAQCCSVFY
jgi:hypothetical protein